MHGCVKRRDCASIFVAVVREQQQCGYKAWGNYLPSMCRSRVCVLSKSIYRATHRSIPIRFSTCIPPPIRPPENPWNVLLMYSHNSYRCSKRLPSWGYGEQILVLCQESCRTVLEGFPQIHIRQRCRLCGSSRTGSNGSRTRCLQNLKHVPHNTRTSQPG